ncbi:hypothetical protein HNP32_003123 [Brevundimonas bullata]|uniref:Uncharacterized protein n=1 Tax=Brevundimonas bullata TaxID=13160 RepID=A0A7W7ISW3_9CAUL|nr:hypothetical protein [Brevundimonas bullata]MBB4799365.1 hypothetical protein [Brevundimonas bullata]MBB6384563.1 hypothetical protein [Brevundimonas bullata]
MSAQRNNSTAPRTRPGFNRPAPMRLRMGLIMRKGMDFGPLGDMETALRIDGVSLAPISTGDTSLVSGGVTVLATATAEDITSGRVKGVVVPGGEADEAGVAQVKSLLLLAKAQGLPVLAFADSVALAAEVFGLTADAPGAVFRGDKVALINERAELSAVVATIA